MARAHGRRRRRGGAPQRRPSRAAAPRRGRGARRPSRRRAVTRGRAGGDAIHCRGRRAARAAARRSPCWSPRCSSTRRARCTSGCSALPGAARRRASGSASASRSSAVALGARSADARAGDRARGCCSPTCCRRRARWCCCRCPPWPPPTSPSWPTSTSAATRSPRRSGPARAASSGFGVIHTAAARLGERTEPPARCAAPRTRATVRLRRLHARRARARPRAAARRALRRARRSRWWRQYGLDDLEVLHYLFGPDRAELPRALGDGADAHAGSASRGSSTGPTASSRRSPS